MSNSLKYFGTDGIRGHVGQFPMNAEFVLKLGWAVGKMMKAHGSEKVIIGKDTRISGYMFESALEAGLSATGVHTLLLGPMPTPAIAYLTKELNAKAGIVISASHNPYFDNGIKFFSAEGYKLSDDVEHEIENNLEKPFTTNESKELGKVSRLNNAIEKYSEFCKQTISDKSIFKNLTIVLDCANGATYHVAPHLFRNLGAKIIELGTNPDGLNINENCGSLHPEELCQAVLKHNAHLGIAYDGDGDRVIMVDECGEIINGDQMLYVIAKYLHLKNKFTGGIVGTHMSNAGLELALKKISIPFKRCDVGDQHVMRELLHSNWLLGGEPTGHIVCLHHTTTGDGIISSLQVIEALYFLNKTLNQIKQEIIMHPQIVLNIKNESNCKIDINNQQVKKFMDGAIKKLGEQTRILIRPSGTEPVLRIMIETENHTMLSKISNDFTDFFTDLINNNWNQ